MYSLSGVCSPQRRLRPCLSATLRCLLRAAPAKAFPTDAPFRSSIRAAGLRGYYTLVGPAPCTAAAYVRQPPTGWPIVCCRLSAVQVLLPPGHRCIAAVMDELRRLVDALLTSDAFSRRRAFGPVAHAAPAPAAVGRAPCAPLRCVLAHGCGGSILASCATVRSPARSEGVSVVVRVARSVFEPVGTGNVW
jgi:hypothetical protein